MKDSDLPPLRERFPNLQRQWAQTARARSEALRYWPPAKASLLHKRAPGRFDVVLKGVKHYPNGAVLRSRAVLPNSSN